MAGSSAFLLYLVTYLAFRQEYLAAGFILACSLLALFFQRDRFYKAGRYSRRIIVTSGLVGLVAGASLGYQRAAQLSPNQATKQLKSQNIELTISRVSARSLVARGQAGKMRLTGLARPASEFFEGQKLRVSCQAYDRPGTSIFNTLEKLQGIHFYCQVDKLQSEKSPGSLFRHWQLKLMHTMKENLATLPPTSLAEAVLFADTGYLDSYDLMLYRKMGIAHLFSASGLHMGLLFGFVFLPFYWLRKEWAGRILATLACLGFLFLLDFRISLLRAFAFLLMYLLLRWQDRKVHAIHILFWAALLIEMIYPGSSFSLSFILSFSITAAIILLYQPCYRLLRLRWQPLRAHLALSLVTFTSSALLSLFFFGYASIFSLFFNLLLVPLASIYLALALIATIFQPATLLVDLLDHVFVFAAWLFHQWYRFFPAVSLLYSAIFFALCLSIFLLALYLHRKRKLLLVRKHNRWPVFALLALAYFSQFLFFGKNQQAVRMFPFGAQYLSGGTYAIYGKPAPFLEPGWQGKLPPLTIQNLQALPGNYPIFGGMLKYYNKVASLPNDGPCFLHFSKLQVTSWRPGQFSQCPVLYLAYTKKVKRQVLTRQSGWQKLFRQFGHRGKLVLLPYFKWHYFNKT